MVAELQPAPPAKHSETEREATGSPVLKCSLMTAASTAWPRASGDQSACVGFVEARIAIDFTGTASGATRGFERPDASGGPPFRDGTAFGGHLSIVYSPHCALSRVKFPADSGRLPAARTAVAPIIANRRKRAQTRAPQHLKLCRDSTYNAVSTTVSRRRG